MHLLATTTATLDDITEAVDLRQPPGDIIVLSFADSDLSGLAAGCRCNASTPPPTATIPLTGKLRIRRLGSRFRSHATPPARRQGAGKFR